MADQNQEALIDLENQYEITPRSSDSIIDRLQEIKKAQSDIKEELEDMGVDVDEGSNTGYGF